MRVNLVRPEYFFLLRIKLLAGRLWDQPEIVRAARLAVINQTMAKQYWPEGDAIGRQVRMPDMKADPPFMLAGKDSDSWLQIIGIVADARDDGLRNAVKPGSLRAVLHAHVDVHAGADADADRPPVESQSHPRRG